MPILSASFPEGYPVGPPEQLYYIEEDTELMDAISSEALPLEEGEHDVTPATLVDVCKFYLFVHNERKATLMSDPQCDRTGMEGENKIITDAEDEGMRLIEVHDRSNLKGRLFEVIFYSDDLM